MQRASSIDYDVLTKIEDVVEVEKEEVCLSGWIIRFNSTNKKIYALLKVVDSNDEVLVLADTNVRNDIPSVFSEGEDFGECGFYVQIPEEKIKQDVCYEIEFVLEYYENEENEKKKETYIKKINSGKYLYNGEIYTYNPTTFEKPNIEDEQLRIVIEDGDLKKYDKEEKLWIYQYEGELYFILDSTFGSMAETGIGIPVMPKTCQEELLPEHRKQYGFDHIGFYYENMEYQREGVLPYQVVKVSLPTEYVITYISTGLFIDREDKWLKAINIPMIN